MINLPMINKHFFKTLILFTAMIAIGLAGIFVVSFLSASEEESTSVEVDNVAN